MQAIEAELGSVVRITSDDDDQSYMLVEPQDADMFAYRVSVRSPLGKALLHKHKDDIISIKKGQSKRTYVVKDIIPSSFLDYVKEAA